MSEFGRAGAAAGRGKGGMGDTGEVPYRIVAQFVAKNVRIRSVLAQRLFLIVSKLVTLKYTQYGGEGYLRGGD
jgi:hypothetical protein